MRRCLCAFSGELDGGVSDTAEGQALTKDQRAFFVFLFSGWRLSGICQAQQTIHLCCSLLGVWVGFSIVGENWREGVA